MQGVLGFGFGIVAMALLPLALSVKEASPLVVIFTLPVVIIAFCAHWRHFQWRDGWLLIVGTCIGIPLGVHLLTVASGPLLLRLLGGVLLVFAAYELFSQFRPHFKIGFPRWSAAPVGILSGAASGAFNAGGPPLVAYSYAQSWGKERVVALLQVIFTIGAMLRLSTMLGGGLFTPTVIKIATWGALPVLITLLIGTAVLRRIATEKLRSTVFVFIGLIALKYLFWA